MRILYLAHRLPYPPNKGDKIRSFWQVKALAREHEVDLFSFYDYPEDRKYVDALRPYVRECYAEQLSPWMSRLRAGAALLRGRPFSLGYFSSATMRAAVERALRERHYDAVFVFSSSMAQYAEQAAGCRRVMDFIDVDSDKWVQYAGSSRFPTSLVWGAEGRRLGAYERRIAETFDATVVCTDAEADICRRVTGVTSIGVLPNCVDLEYFDPRQVEIPEHIRALGPYVIFSGSMDYRPNDEAALYFAAEVLPLLRREVPQIKFVIAGRKPSDAVVRLAAIDPSVVATGEVTDIRPWVTGAALAVAPLRIARGVQNKVLEALALGTPVVCTRRVAAALPAPLRQVLAEADAPAELAQACAAALSAPAKADAGRALLARFYSDDQVYAALQALLVPQPLARRTGA